MKNSRALMVCGVVLLNLFATSICSAQYQHLDESAKVQNKLTTEFVKTGLYVITGEGNNSVLRLSGNGLILVDGKLPGNYDALRKRVRKVSDQPVRYLILTDASLASTGTNPEFAANGSRIIAQNKIADVIKSQKDSDAKAVEAMMAFDSSRTLHLGGIEVQAFYYGNAYGAGDTVIYFPNLKAVAVGRLYCSNLELAAGGSLVGWNSVLEQVLKLDFDTAIPATGPAISKAELQSFQGKISSLIAHAGPLVKQGVPEDQLVSQLNQQDANLRLNLTPEQLHNFYVELSSTQVATK